MKKLLPKFMDENNKKAEASQALVDACHELLTDDAIKPQNAADTKKKLAKIFNEEKHRDVTFLDFDFNNDLESYLKPFIGIVFSVLEKFPRIKSIRITGLNASEEAFKLVAGKLCTNKHLEALTFHYCTIGAGGFAHLTQTLLADNKTLKALSFEDTALGKNFNTLMLALNKIPNLQHLNLYKCGLDDSQMRKLIGKLKGKKTLRTLNIAGNTIEKLKTKTLLGETLFSLPRLTEVVLPAYSGPYMFDENIITLTQLRNKNVSVIYILEDFSKEQLDTCLYAKHAKNNVSIIPYRVVAELYRLPFLYSTNDGRSLFTSMTGEKYDEVFFAAALFNVFENLNKDALLTDPTKENRQSARGAYKEAFTAEAKIKVYDPLNEGEMTREIYLNVRRLYNRYYEKVGFEAIKPLGEYINTYYPVYSEKQKTTKDIRSETPHISMYESTESHLSNSEMSPNKSEEVNFGSGKKRTDFFAELSDDEEPKKNNGKRKKEGLDRKEKLHRLKTVNKGITESTEHLIDKYFN